MKTNGRERTTCYNIGLAIWRMKCFYKTFEQISTEVILLNFCAKIPPHRQSEAVMGILKDNRNDNK